MPPWPNKLTDTVAVAALLVGVASAPANASAMPTSDLAATSPIVRAAGNIPARTPVGREIVRHFQDLKKLLEDGASVLAQEPLRIDPKLLARIHARTEALSQAEVATPDIGEPLLAAALDPEVQAMPVEAQGAEIAQRAERLYEGFETKLDALRNTRNQVRAMAKEAQARYEMARGVTHQLGEVLSTQPGTMADVATGKEVTTVYGDLLVHGLPALRGYANATETLADRLDKAVAKGEADLARHADARSLGRWAALEPMARSVYDAQREAYMIADHLDPPTMAEAQTRIARETIEQGNADTAAAARKLFEAARRKGERMAKHRLVIGVLQVAGGLSALGAAAADSGMTSEEVAPTLPEITIEVEVNTTGGTTAPPPPDIQSTPIIIP